MSLAVDHNHKTGRVRGLLCGNCNTSLGGFKDNPALLNKAIRYIEESEVDAFGVYVGDNLHGEVHKLRTGV